MPSIDHRIFHYSLAEGWKPIDNPLTLAEGQTIDHALLAAGYFPSILIGDQLGVSAQLFLGNETDSPYSHLVEFSDGGCVWEIYASDFPSVLELLHKFATICQATFVQEAYDEVKAARKSDSEKTLDEAVRAITG